MQYDQNYDMQFLGRLGDALTDGGKLVSTKRMREGGLEPPSLAAPDPKSRQDPIIAPSRPSIEPRAANTRQQNPAPAAQNTTKTTTCFPGCAMTGLPSYTQTGDAQPAVEKPERIEDSAEGQAKQADP